ncbi:hypothetical protein AAG747_05720 [Rapidithrix thailandica]|uniref:Uncharacterized protein n=1 Tax=Rapidithrix thailandica TaxID=413964 RepID=A0AAW9S4T0_9BACT
MKNIPESLLSTSALLTESFPNGITQDEYKALIFILYEHMSDRNLSEVLSFFVDKDKIVISNDIPKHCTGQGLQLEMIKNVQENLNRHGFQEWIDED